MANKPFPMSRLAVLVLAVLAAGCSTLPEAFSTGEQRQLAQADRSAAQQGVEPLSGPLTLSEAVARGLKYNLEHRSRMMEQALALGQADLSRFDMLPKLVASGDGHVVTIGSIAAHEPYPGGGGYNAAKFAVRAVMGVLRQELLGQPVRVTEIDPGMVETEFSVVRFGGDESQAAAVYDGMTPLSAEDVADCVAWAATRPSHVNIDQIVVLARDQAGATKVHRRS